MDILAPWNMKYKIYSLRVLQFIYQSIFAQFTNLFIY